MRGCVPEPLRARPAACCSAWALGGVLQGTHLLAPLGEEDQGRGLGQTSGRPGGQEAGRQEEGRREEAGGRERGRGRGTCSLRGQARPGPVTPSGSWLGVGGFLGAPRKHGTPGVWRNGNIQKCF